MPIGMSLPGENTNGHEAIGSDQWLGRADVVEMQRLVEIDQHPLWAVRVRLIQ